MSKIESLTPGQRDEALRFLLSRMGPETRGALMAEHPVTYVRLYPSAADATLDRVRDALALIHDGS